MAEFADKAVVIFFKFGQVLALRLFLPGVKPGVLLRKSLLKVRFGIGKFGNERGVREPKLLFFGGG